MKKRGSKFSNDRLSDAKTPVQIEKARSIIPQNIQHEAFGIYSVPEILDKHHNRHKGNTTSTCLPRRRSSAQRPRTSLLVLKSVKVSVKSNRGFHS